MVGCRSTFKSESRSPEAATDRFDCRHNFTILGALATDQLTQKSHHSFTNGVETHRHHVIYYP